MTVFCSLLQTKVLFRKSNRRLEVVAMLLEVSIKNFAIIEQVSLNFENRMTILSGETGAGKSIIIDAMNLILGRVRRQMLSDMGQG